MSRVKRGFKARHRRKKILKLAKGFYGVRKNHFSTAIHVVRRSLVYAFRDRRVKKREFRKLWVTRINAAARLNGIRYGDFIHGLKKLDIGLDRSVLADLAIKDEAAFSELARKAKAALVQ
jgi:large subunit ribosomal protein L20